MKLSKISGLILVIASLVYAGSVFFHPASVGILTDPVEANPPLTWYFTHGQAIVNWILFVFGFFILSRVLSQQGEQIFSSLGTLVFALVGIFYSIAATFGGFLRPLLARAYFDASTDASQELARMVYEYNGNLNQVFAQVATYLTALGILVVALALLRSNVFNRVFAYVGVLIGAGSLVAAVSGILVVTDSDLGALALFTVVSTLWIGVLGILTYRINESLLPQTSSKPISAPA
jgi:hypothetical protein